MTNLSDLTTGQLHHILSIKEQIEKLQGQIHSIAGGEVPTSFTSKAPKKSRMSPAGRAAIAAGQKARWATIKVTAATPIIPKKRRKVSAAVKAKLATIAKARWAKARAAGKKAL